VWARPVLTGLTVPELLKRSFRDTISHIDRSVHRLQAAAQQRRAEALAAGAGQVSDHRRLMMSLPCQHS
jgi:uncharacterized membrane protein